MRPPLGMQNIMDRRQFIAHLAASGAASLAVGTGLADAVADTMTSQSALDVAAANRELAQHRIRRIEWRRFRDRFPRSIGPNSRGRSVGQGGGFIVCMVTTGRDVTGWCMAGGKPMDSSRFIGTRVGDLFDVGQGIADDVPQWLDKTLHDLAERILNLPVWRMIGGAGAREVLLYSGAIYMEDVVPEDRPRGIRAVLDACLQDYEAGYRAFKLKIGRGRKWMDRGKGLQRDIEVTRSVHEHFSDCRVLVDANDAFTLEEACRYVTAVADCNLYWIEEAFEEDADSYRRLREVMEKVGCKALIAGGEARREQAQPPTAYGGYTQAFIDRLYELAEEKLVDLFVLDLDIVGFSRWRRVMPQLRKAGVQASPHAWMWTMRTHQTARLAAGVGNIPIVEGISGQAPGIDFSAYRMRVGNLIVPDEHGFGFRIEK